MNNGIFRQPETAIPFIFLIDHKKGEYKIRPYVNHPNVFYTAFRPSENLCALIDPQKFLS